jgi:hypothetical protein
MEFLRKVLADRPEVKKIEVKIDALEYRRDGWKERLSRLDLDDAEGIEGCQGKINALEDQIDCLEVELDEGPLEPAFAEPSDREIKKFLIQCEIELIDEQIDRQMLGRIERFSPRMLFNTICRFGLGGLSSAEQLAWKILHPAPNRT